MVKPVQSLYKIHNCSPYRKLFFSNNPSSGNQDLWEKLKMSQHLLQRLLPFYARSEAVIEPIIITESALALGTRLKGNMHLLYHLCKSFHIWLWQCDQSRWCSFHEASWNPPPLRNSRTPSEPKVKIIDRYVVSWTVCRVLIHTQYLARHRPHNLSDKLSDFDISFSTFSDKANATADKIKQSITMEMFWL